MKIIVRFFNVVRASIYRLTKGILGGYMPGFKVLLLTTTGRKSGKAYTIPLGRFDQEGGIVVVASNAGRRNHPDWYLNLKSNPHVSVQVMGKVMPATAEVLSGEARAKAWQKVIASAPMYAGYEKLTTREIPLILLHPN